MPEIGAPRRIRAERGAGRTPFAGGGGRDPDTVRSLPGVSQGTEVVAVRGKRRTKEKAPSASTKRPRPPFSPRLGSSRGLRWTNKSWTETVGGRRRRLGARDPRAGAEAGAEAPQPAPPPAVPSRVRARPHQLSARRVSRGVRVEGHGALTMELSESVQKGFQMLADPGSFDSNAFTLLLRAAFQSLLDAQADEAVLGKPLGSARSWIRRGGGALGEEEPAEREGESPGKRKSPGFALRSGRSVGDVALPGLGADSEHCFGPTWHLHRANSTFLARFPSQSLCSFVKPVFKSCLWPKHLRCLALSEAAAVLTVGLHLGSSLQFKLPGLG